MTTRTIKFSAVIEIIGVNPFIYLPPMVLEFIFVQAGKNKGKIPVRIEIEGHEFVQTLVKYSGHWRLYLNTPMRKAAKKKAGDSAIFKIAFDPKKRDIKPHPTFLKALRQNKLAKKVFVQLTPYLQFEIIRYISFLKTQESINRNVTKAIDFLLGKGRFVGRDKPLK
jgi:uncharacterized protein YdeI (YjbR/CyaY-like superfamily)